MRSKTVNAKAKIARVDCEEGRDLEGGEVPYFLSYKQFKTLLIPRIQYKKRNKLRGVKT